MDISKQNERSGEGTLSDQDVASSNGAAMDVKHQKSDVSTKQNKKTLRQETKNKSSDASEHESEAKMDGWEVEEITISGITPAQFVEMSEAYFAKSSGNQE